MSNVNGWVRQFHRWISMVFVLTVLANTGAYATGHNPPPAWITYAPLAPLFALMLTGLYLFILPYTAKRRGRA